MGGERGGQVVEVIGEHRHSASSCFGCGRLGGSGGLADSAAGTSAELTARSRSSISKGLYTTETSLLVKCPCSSSTTLMAVVQITTGMRAVDWRIRSFWSSC